MPGRGLFHLLAVSAVVMGITQTIAKERIFAPLRDAPILGWFFSCVLVVVVAAFLRVAFWLVDEEQGLVRRRQRTEDEEAATRRVVRSRIEHGDHVAPPPRH